MSFYEKIASYETLARGWQRVEILGKGQVTQDPTYYIV